MVGKVGHCSEKETGRRQLGAIRETARARERCSLVVDGDPEHSQAAAVDTKQTGKR